ncbi:MAG: amidohydrolase family protein [Chloroflexi bacterium]|nr:amidohydrolase family protein [Chloroflexota bacterium]
MDRDIMELFARPDYGVGSDAIMVGGKPHPRAYGTFPRLLGRLRRKHGRPSLEALVNRSTYVTARRFGLRDRGLVRRGFAADLVVFDPETLIDTATYDEPSAFPVGIKAVIVNGVIAARNGRPTGALAGRALP